MSNLLFRNIANIFSAPAIVGEILKKMDKAQEERGRNSKTTLDEAGNVSVDENGNVMIPSEVIVGQEQQIFGDKLYETLDEITADNEKAMDEGNVLAAIDHVSETLESAVEQNIIMPAVDEYKLKTSEAKRLVIESKKELQAKMEKIKGDFEQQRKIAEVKHEEARQQATTEKELSDADTAFLREMEKATENVSNAIKKVSEETIKNKPKEVVERIERDKEEIICLSSMEW